MSSKGEQQGAAVRGLRSGGCGQGAAVRGLRVSCLILDSVDRSVRTLEMGFVAGQ